MGRSIKPSSTNTWFYIQEVVVRVVLFIIFRVSEKVEPFKRIMQEEELWLYKNPHGTEYVTSSALWLLLVLVPAMLILIHFCINKDMKEIYSFSSAYTLTLPLTGMLTNMVKLIVGRPRPDFLARCFPDGIKDVTTHTNNLLSVTLKDISDQCTGDPLVIMDGRKSFPSGHSSMAFCGMGFLFFWLCGQFRIFSSNRGDSSRLVITVVPLLTATCVALSRTCDYHHHWQDVLVGSLLGLFISFICYRQYYPSFVSRDSSVKDDSGYRNLYDYTDNKLNYPIGKSSLPYFSSEASSLSSREGSAAPTAVGAYSPPEHGHFSSRQSNSGSSNSRKD